MANKLVIILPESLLGAKSYQSLRKQIFYQFGIKVISLPQKTFLNTTCKASVLYLSNVRKGDFIEYAKLGES